MALYLDDIIDKRGPQEGNLPLAWGHDNLAGPLPTNFRLGVSSEFVGCSAIWTEFLGVATNPSFSGHTNFQHCNALHKQAEKLVYLFRANLLGLHFFHLKA